MIKGMAPGWQMLHPADRVWQVENLQFALDQSVNVVVTDENGVIQYANDNFCRTTGYAPNDVIGQTHQLVNAGYHPPAFFQALWETITAGHVWHGEIQNRARDGSLYWVKTTIVPFLDEAGVPRQYISIHTDITEQKEAQARILDLNSQLEEQVAQRTQHLEALNRELREILQDYQLQAAQFKDHLMRGLELIQAADMADMPRIPLSETHVSFSDSGLSERERDVMALLVQGQTNKEIAEALCITVHTAKAHVSSILQKLGVQDRTQAAVRALKSGWID